MNDEIEQTEVIVEYADLPPEGKAIIDRILDDMEKKKGIVRDYPKRR